MAKEKKPMSASAQAMSEVLKSNPGTKYTFTDLATAAGVEAKIGDLSSLRANMPELKSEKGNAPVEKKISVFTYNAPETPFESKSQPSENSIAVANYFRENEGNEYSLAQLSDALGFKVLSGHIAGARAILGKDNIVRGDATITVDAEKTLYWVD